MCFASSSAQELLLCLTRWLRGVGHCSVADVDACKHWHPPHGSAQPPL